MQLAAGQAQDNPPDSQRVRMKDACFLIYTSGTTGLPKASIMSHGKWIKAYGGFGHSGSHCVSGVVASHASTPPWAAWFMRRKWW